MPFPACTSPVSRAIEIVYAIGNKERHNEFKSPGEKGEKGDLEWVGPKEEGCLGLEECRPGAPARIGARENLREGWKREWGVREQRERASHGGVGTGQRDARQATDGSVLLHLPVGKVPSL